MVKKKGSKNGAVITTDKEGITMPEKATKTLKPVYVFCDGKLTQHIGKKAVREAINEYIDGGFEVKDITVIRGSIIPLTVETKPVIKLG